MTSTLEHSSEQSQAADHLRWAQEAKSRDQFIRWPGHQPRLVGATQAAHHKMIISPRSPQVGLINAIRQAPANTIHASLSLFIIILEIKHELGEEYRASDWVGGGRGCVVTAGTVDITRQTSLSCITIASVSFNKKILNPELLDTFRFCQQ